MATGWRLSPTPLDMTRLTRSARHQLYELPATLQAVDTSPERCAQFATLDLDARAKLLLALMRRDGLEQQEAAKRCGVSSSTVLRILRRTGHLSTKELARVRRYVETGQRATRGGLSEKELNTYRVVMARLTALSPTERKRVMRFVRIALQDAKVLQHTARDP